MNAEQRPGSSTSLRRIRPSRSSVSQQPRMFSTSTQAESVAGLEPDAALPGS